jgi:hypothetical protein
MLARCGLGKFRLRKCIRPADELPGAVMDTITESILFTAFSALLLTTGIVTHILWLKFRQRRPILILRALYSSSVIFASVGMLLFGDYLCA